MSLPCLSLQVEKKLIMIIYITIISIICSLLRLILCRYYSLLVGHNKMIKVPWGTIFDADMSGTLVRILAVPSSVV